MSRGSETPEESLRRLPVDADEPPDPHPRGGRRPSLRELVHGRADIVVVIAAGGVCGSVGRWLVGELLDHSPGQFAWNTFTVNLSGAFLLGVLMAFMVDVLATTRFVRPFLGVGLLGGWTTFSTYMLDTRTMLAAGHVPAALVLYLGGTLLIGLVAVWAGLVGGRALIVLARHRAAERRHGHEITDDTPETDG